MEAGARTHEEARAVARGGGLVAVRDFITPTKPKGQSLLPLHTIATIDVGGGPENATGRLHCPRGGGCGPPSRRLGGNDRPPLRRGAIPLRDRLLLDPTPLLGAVAPHEGRVRARGSADAAGRPQRG